MPGFVVNGFGKGAPASVKPYYKYTWEVSQFYGDVIGEGSAPLIYLKDATLPSWEFEREELQGSSLVYKFAKSIKWNDLKLTWYDTVGLADKVRSWRRSVWTAIDGLMSPDNYKKTSTIKSYTFAWTKPVTWMVYNSWPISVKSSDLTYTESDVKMVEVTLAYDWADDFTS